MRIARSQICSIGAVLFIASAAAATADAQAKRSGGASPATVEGDVYFVNQAGDTKRAAGRVVALLADPDSSLHDRAKRMCVGGVQRVAPLVHWLKALVDSEQLARSDRPDAPSMYDIVSREVRIKKGMKEIVAESRDSIFRLFATRILDSTSTGMQAHYRLSVAKPGRYDLFSEWSLGEHEYVWFAPLSIAKGQRTIKRDLDNSAIDDGQIMCGELDLLVSRVASQP